MQSNGNTVCKFIEKVLNLGDIDAAGEFFWDDMVEQVPLPHRGTFLGVPATGRPVTVWGIAIDRFEGGKIKDTRIIMDTLGLMMQLGVVPPPTA
jgi:hypothetical protein